MTYLPFVSLKENNGTFHFLYWISEEKIPQFPKLYGKQNDSNCLSVVIEREVVFSQKFTECLPLTSCLQDVRVS